MSKGKAKAYIGILELRLYMPHAHSLKEKRAFVKSIIEKIKNRFNVSIAEIGDLDKWQTSVIGITSIGNSKSIIDSRFEKIVDYVERYFPGNLISHTKEFF